MTTRDEYVESMKLFLSSLMKKNAIAWITQLVPKLMAIGFAQNLVAFALGLIISKALEGLEMLSFFKYIDVRVNEQGHDFADAAMENYRVHLNGTKEEKEIAETKAFDKFAAFVVLTS